MKKKIFGRRLAAMLLLAAMIVSLAGMMSGCIRSGDAQSGEVTDNVDIDGESFFLKGEGETMELVEEEIPLAGSAPVADVLEPVASGKTVYKGGSAVIDASNITDGYVMIKYTGSKSDKLKVIVTCPDKVKYTYNLTASGDYETFPLSGGSGSYTVGVYKNVSGTKYTKRISKTVSVKLSDEFAPFLRPNQYVNFTSDSEAVKLAEKLTAGCKDELSKVETVYNYVVKNLTYDKNRADTVKSGYLPDIDDVLKKKKGICFDYAALMTAMLRSVGVPTKLVVGYAGTVYHAWISTYSEKDGWIDGSIYFDGSQWKRMDPTFASSAKSSASILKYIGNGSNYTDKYLY